MKRFLKAVVFTILLLNAEDVFSQIDTSYRWTWIGGSAGYDATGVYGRKGVESPINQPGGRFDFASWTDRNGNLWLFGGYGRAASSAPGWLNDLWRYNISTNQWTWMAGDTLINQPNYQSGIGIESSNNTPSARSAVSGWASDDGTELYLYGGATNIDGGGDEINGDVWAFNIGSAKWRILKYAVYNDTGCSGQSYTSPLCNSSFSPGTWPICREAAAVSAINGAAFVYGGQVGALQNGEFFRFSDYNHGVSTPDCPVNNQWASIQFGADYINNSVGYYTDAFRRRPGSRRDASSFAYFSGVKDNFYLFGGSGFGAFVNGVSNLGSLNDLWRYDGQDPATQKPIWTWLKGDTTINQGGSYGIKGVAEFSNNPPARYRSPMKKVNNSQAILFGGAGFSTTGFGVLNDLWSYDPASNMWTWIGGSSIAGHGGSYGIQGMQAGSNLIPAREGATMWISNDDVYIFGGCCNFKNDLWKFSKPQDLITIDAINTNTFYPGSQIKVSYTIHPQASNPFDTSNIFYLEITDNNGSVPKYYVTGATHSNTSGMLITTIPYYMGSGSNFTLNIISTKPSHTSPAYSQPITINPNPIVAAQAQAVFANKEFTMSDGWTNYYNDTLLVLSLQKNGNNIGSIGDGTFAVECAATQFAGDGTGVHVTNPLVTNTSGYWTMNRFWTVKPTYEPSAPVGVRFYFNDADLQDVKASVPAISSVTDLQFYKTIGGNPDPTSNWAGATSVIPILNGTIATDTSWTYQLYANGMYRAEFMVNSFSGGGGGGTQDGLVLPVQLTAFTATLQNANAIVKWQTATEINTSYYTVQRSVDGINFIGLDKVTATHNTSSGKDYTYYDKAINNLNTKSVFYRLQITDKDGKISYSQVMVVKVLHQHLFTLLPNPAKDKIIVSGEKLSSVKIYDVNGKLLIIHSNIELDNAIISVNNLSKGVYIVQIEDKNRNKEIKKLIVE